MGITGVVQPECGGHLMGQDTPTGREPTLSCDSFSFLATLMLAFAWVFSRDKK